MAVKFKTVTPVTGNKDVAAAALTLVDSAKAFSTHSNIPVTRAETLANTKRDAKGAVDALGSIANSLEKMQQVRPFAVSKDAQTLIWNAAIGAYGEKVQENVLVAIAASEGLGYAVTVEDLEKEDILKELATKLVGSTPAQQLFIADGFATLFSSIANILTLNEQNNRNTLKAQVDSLDGRIMVVQHNGVYHALKVYVKNSDITHTENEVVNAVVTLTNKGRITITEVEPPKTKMVDKALEGTTATYKYEEKLPLVMKPQFGVANANAASLMPLIEAAAFCYSTISADGNSRVFQIENWPFDFKMNPALQNPVVAEWARDGFETHKDEIIKFFATNNFNELVGNYVGQATCIYSVPNDENFSGYATATGIRFFDGAGSLANMTQTAIPTLTVIDFCKTERQNENRKDAAMANVMKNARQLRELRALSKDEDDTQALLIRQLKSSGLGSKLNGLDILDFITIQPESKQNSQVDLED